MTRVVYPPFGSGSLANPTASVGLAAVNGSALTAMRSDGAPALDQTAAFVFSGLGSPLTVGASGASRLQLVIGGGTFPTLNWINSSSTTFAAITAGTATGSMFLDTTGALNVRNAIGGGSTLMALSNNGQTATFGAVVLGNPTSGKEFISFSGDAFVSRGNAAATLQLGAANAASPVAQTLQAQNAATGNNNGAATFTDIASLSVGNGTSGDRVFQTGKNGNGSGVLATATTALTIKGETQAVVIAAGKTFQLGNAATTGLVAGVLAATTNASIVITDSTGQAYRIPCII